MKFLSILVLCILSCNGISGMVNKRTTAFKSVKKCAKEHDLDFTVITKFFKGDFSVDTKNVRVSEEEMVHQKSVELIEMLSVLLKMRCERPGILDRWETTEVKHNELRWHFGQEHRRSKKNWREIRARYLLNFFCRPTTSSRNVLTMTCPMTSVTIFTTSSNVSGNKRWINRVKKLSSMIFISTKTS